MPLESNADKAYMHDLPKVSFRVITDDQSILAPAGVNSEQSRSYGYNDFSEFERSEHYIRYIEPIESELAVQVEYDMDEQDQEWLDAINAERKKEQSGAISYEVFEILMDKLEKEWFNLSKRIPQPVQHLAAEDSKCAVCDDGEGENSNAIVFCDGCNLAVHQDCYGVPYIPEGQWLCRKCTVSPENPVSCIFCPNEGGAFKQTTSGHWSHLLCAIWIPETGLGNAIYMEPVEGVESVPKSRWKLVCSLCREKTGACIQCDNRNCFTAFHVTCARQAGLLSSMKSFSQDGLLKAYCHKHLPVSLPDNFQPEEISDTASDFSSFSEMIPKQTTKTEKKARRSSTANGQAAAVVPTTKKSAQAHSKSFRPGPPIIPRLILDKVLNYVAKVAIRKRQPFVERMCRYWSLKREARRGAPLLKRLHLEPWTASSDSRQQTETEKAQKLKFLQMLRNDLEKVRMLAELVRKREKEKLRQVQLIKDVVDGFIFPYHGRLRVAFEKISAQVLPSSQYCRYMLTLLFRLDRQSLYLHPVNRAEAPDYFEIIKEPMCWLWIDEKLEKNEYVDLADFKRDIMLLLDNAMIYNPKDNPYHRRAAKIKKEAEPILTELDNITETARASYQTYASEKNAILPVGDLEPTSTVLSTLLQQCSGPDNPTQDHLGSIFSFELEKPKEPTPPPPSKPVKAPRKSSSHAERKQKWEDRENAAKERTLAGSRSTRATRAAEIAFDQEAGIQPSSSAEGSKHTSVEPKEELDARSRRRSMREINAIAGPSTTPASNKKGKGKNRVKSEVVPQTEATAGLRTSTSVSLTTSGSASPTKPSSSFPRRHRSQVGVVGTEIVPILTDRDRRERERAMDIMIEEVGAQDQFTRFNTGWVLPEGMKRKRTERTSDSFPRAPSASSSRKPPSTAASKARASATPRTLRLSLSPIKSQHTEHAPISSGSGSDLSSPPPSAVPTPRKTTRQTEHGEKRKAPLDEETTSPRQSKRARRTRSAGNTDTHDDVVVDDDEDNEEMTPIPEDLSDQKEISEEIEEVEEVEQVEQPKEEDDKPSPSKAKNNSKSKVKVMSVSPTKTKQELQKDAAQYEPGVLVHTYPYFPAMVVDLNEPEGIPSDVLSIEARERAAAKAAGKKVWLVNFFDNSASYGWVMEDKLDLLGTDEALDALYLSGKTRNKTNKYKPHAIKMVKKGYRDALATLQTEEEDEAEEV
ncbi:hypothetical protein L486_08112 [Kwoniella mangroviensis CBS 10435]|uniref:NuA3 HAT complex component NTO1 n=1 Tax=Kwoniella mangroviensis CBS 10435 TaxID=1331196 RepID=A0A1B9IGI5_9TREE|nr:hypothetical protein L486_08112 [Kwoniella mangroviensis CBS 10435]